MMMTKTDKLIRLIESMLTDENGVSEETYNSLIAFIDELTPNAYYKAQKLLRQTDATDGRFYIPLCSKAVEDGECVRNRNHLGGHSVKNEDKNR
jgi:hypothetical protein